jgi:hypothetical protein
VTEVCKVKVKVEVVQVRSICTLASGQ